MSNFSLVHSVPLERAGIGTDLVEHTPFDHSVANLGQGQSNDYLEQATPAPVRRLPLFDDPDDDVPARRLIGTPIAVLAPFVRSRFDEPEDEALARRLAGTPLALLLPFARLPIGEEFDAETAMRLVAAPPLAKGVPSTLLLALRQFEEAEEEPRLRLRRFYIPPFIRPFVWVAI